MKPLTKNIWKLIKKQYDEIAKEDNNFVFAEDKYHVFHESFKETYSFIKNKYMLETVKHLDRHKVAAILVICILENDIITYNSNLTNNNCFSCSQDIDGDIFIGAELFALKASLSYMLEKLNEKLNEANVGKKIETFYFPKAFSCETPYIEILCRNLYYAKKDYKLNPLDLSERLFLLEYICLLQHKIEPELLKEYT